MPTATMRLARSPPSTESGSRGSSDRVGQVPSRTPALQFCSSRFPVQASPVRFSEKSLPREAPYGIWKMGISRPSWSERHPIGTGYQAGAKGAPSRPPAKGSSGVRVPPFACLLHTQAVVEWTHLGTLPGEGDLRSSLIHAVLQWAYPGTESALLRGQHPGSRGLSILSGRIRMDEPAPTTAPSAPLRERADALGIVIADGGLGARSGLTAPRVRAFIYGEEPESPPTLPFGRWKEAS
jgi:hypothetical protein